MKRSLAIAALVTMITAGCGGGENASEVASLAESAPSPGPSSDASVSGDALTDEEALLAFAACMRDVGVDVEDPTVDADGNLRPGGLRGAAPGGEQGGLDREAAGEAFQTCRELLDGVAIGFGRQDRIEIEDRLLAFASCMRDNNVDIPDPDFASGPGARGPLGEIDPDDPAFVTALEACEDLLPGFGAPGPGAGPRPGA